MADQEFLVSYGVKIDEGGVARLQSLLEQDRKLAEGLSSAFHSADSAVEGFLRNAAGKAAADAGSDLLSRMGKQVYGLSRLRRAEPAGEAPEGYRAPGIRGQVQDLFSGALTERPDSSLGNYVMRSSELVWGGTASRDSRNYVEGNSAGRPALADFGVAGEDPAWLADIKEQAEDIMREPLRQVRQVMKDAVEAEERGEDTAPYLEKVERILKEPLEEVRRLYETIDAFETENKGAGWSEQLAEIDEKWSALAKRMDEPVTVQLNTSSALSAARAAVEGIRNLFSGQLNLNVNTNVNSSAGNGNPFTKPAGGSTFLRMSSGGRFTRPTEVQVAEDGDAEYIIPVKKEDRAVPLLRQLLGELSPAALESLAGGNGAGMAGFPGSLAAGQPANMAVTQNNQNVSAPVSIQVHASGADGKQIGESIYDTAERYLVRTLRSFA